MLRASSLGSISNLTTRITFRQCHPVLGIRASSAPQVRIVSTLRAPDARDDASSHSHQTHSVHTPQKVDTKDQEQIDPVAPPPHDAFDGETVEGQPQSSFSPAQSLPAILIEQEREAWKNAEVDEVPYVRQSLPYTTGKSQYLLPLRPLYGGKFRKGKTFESVDRVDRANSRPKQEPSTLTPLEQDLDPEVFDANLSYKDTPDTTGLYYYLCDTIANTQSVSEAWMAYSTILTLPPSQIPCQGQKIPFEHLHRLCRLLSRNQRRTRTQFLRLLSVLYSIHKNGGQIHTFEWNALILNAGTGWRKARPEDFKLALDVFSDMVSGMSPGSTFSPMDYPSLERSSQPALPDIYTYNTLISIAAKTLYGRAVKRATTMLQQAGHAPDRITHLSLMAFFTGSHQLTGVRSTLHKMQQQGLELGLDGINACIWAYGYNGQYDTVKNIYRVLRHNVEPEYPDEEVSSIARGLLNEGIRISPLMRPNELTFTAIVQTMAWRGNLTVAYSVLLDMLASENLELGAPLFRGEDGELNHQPYTATYAVFRAIFLGFSRHGVTIEANFVSRLRSSQTWTLKYLRAIYDIYIDLPEPLHPSKSMIYWIMVAFDKTSGHDVGLLRQIWSELEARFQGPWGGPKHRLRKMRDILFSEGAEDHLRKCGFHTTFIEVRSNKVKPWLE